MKKVIVILLAAFWAAGYVCAQEVDLQIQRAYVQNFYGDGGYQVDFLYVDIQNNGPDDFEGSFDISASHGNPAGLATFSGKISAFGMATVSVIGSPKDVAYSLYLDPDNRIQERNEDNNYLYYKASEPQVRIMSGGLIAQDVFDTLYVTPGEFYGADFYVQDLNEHNSMIGAEFSMVTYDFIDHLGFSTTVSYIHNFMDGYTCSVKRFDDPYSPRKEIKITLLANSSEYASRAYWMSDFWGYGENQIGKIGNVYIYAKFALTNLQNGYDNVRKTIKVIDAIRCDINGDGVVDSDDLDMLSEVVDGNLFNSWDGRKNRYTKKGINYGAGRILFSQPDFLSVALLHIWLNNPNDPLVQGLGIGELMSTTMPGSSASSVKPIDNTFTVESGKVKINAPEADVYNVTAQDADGKMIQRTGRVGEEISLPVDAQNIRVETVKIKNGTTGLFSATQTGPKVSVYPNPVTDYVNISSPEYGRLSIMNLNGQEIYSQPINANETLNLSASDWAKGIYLIKIATATGQSTVKVVK